MSLAHFLYRVPVGKSIFRCGEGLCGILSSRTPAGNAPGLRKAENLQPFKVRRAPSPGPLGHRGLRGRLVQGRFASASLSTWPDLSQGLQQ